MHVKLKAFFRLSSGTQGISLCHERGSNIVFQMAEKNELQLNQEKSLLSHFGLI